MKKFFCRIALLCSCLPSMAQVSSDDITYVSTDRGSLYFKKIIEVQGDYLSEDYVLPAKGAPDIDFNTGAKFRSNEDGTRFIQVLVEGTYYFEMNEEGWLFRSEKDNLSLTYKQKVFYLNEGDNRKRVNENFARGVFAKLFKGCVKVTKNQGVKKARVVYELIKSLSPCIVDMKVFSFDLPRYKPRKRNILGLSGTYFHDGNYFYKAPFLDYTVKKILLPSPNNFYNNPNDVLEGTPSRKMDPQISGSGLGTGFNFSRVLKSYDRYEFSRIRYGLDLNYVKVSGQGDINFDLDRPENRGREYTGGNYDFEASYLIVNVPVTIDLGLKATAKENVRMSFGAFAGFVSTFDATYNYNLMSGRAEIPESYEDGVFELGYGVESGLSYVLRRDNKTRLGFNLDYQLYVLQKYDASHLLNVGFFIEL